MGMDLFLSCTEFYSSRKQVASQSDSPANFQYKYHEFQLKPRVVRY